MTEATNGNLYWLEGAYMRLLPTSDEALKLVLREVAALVETGSTHGHEVSKETGLQWHQLFELGSAIRGLPSPQVPELMVRAIMSDLVARFGAPTYLDDPDYECGKYADVLAGLLVAVILAAVAENSPTVRASLPYEQRTLTALYGALLKRERSYDEPLHDTLASVCRLSLTHVLEFARHPDCRTDRVRLVRELEGHAIQACGVLDRMWGQP